MTSKELRNVQLVEAQYKEHKGDWLTEEVVKEYQKRAKALKSLNMQITGERRELCLELMEKYGILEIEAVNIINGYHSKDYVNKYYRIRNKIPLKSTGKRYADEEEDEF